MPTATLPASEVAQKINAAFPGSIVELSETAVTVPAERIVEIATFLRDDPELDAKFLNTLLGVDWLDYFDVVYQVSSLAKNHTFTLKARAADHNRPMVPSVNGVWMAANLQEREVYDLMGIVFLDHPNLKRVFLWEGFPGHPLRKDFLALPGGYKPGLQRFPFEFPAGQRSYPALQNTQSPAAPTVPRLDQPPEPALPILDPDDTQREALAENAALDAEAQAEAPIQGAGDDVSQAGGTADIPPPEGPAT